MTKGRKALPTAVKELRGNPGRRPLNDKEPKSERLSERVPRNLSPLAAYFWRKYVVKLIHMGVATEVDEPALILMAEHWSMARQALTEINTQGLSTVDEAGLPRKHPLLQVWRDNSAAFRGYASEFGMTASSRSKVRIEPEDQLSMADALFAAVADRMQSAAEVDPLAEFADDGD
jgi:P27 family predicted phage terminase small subunit